MLHVRMMSLSIAEVAVGFFSSLKSAAIEANEEAHGARLLNETKSTFELLRRMDEDLMGAVAMGFLQIRRKLAGEMGNWSRDGRIKVGREMQSQARAQFDFDQRGSYAKWLAGAWIESRERGSLKAQQAFEILEGLADAVEGSRSRNVANTQKVKSMGFGYSTWDQWLLAFKRSAGQANSQLKPDGNNRSFIDFMDQSPLKRAFRDQIDPNDLGRQFAQQFDVNTFGRR